jgi:hypothetical protein
LGGPLLKLCPSAPSCIQDGRLLKSSSLCLYSSNLGTFWLKIEQFCPFEEISIFCNGGHLGYRTGLTDKTDGKLKLQTCSACQDLPTLQFWSKFDYPSWSSCPFFIKFIKKKKNTFKIENILMKKGQ